VQADIEGRPVRDGDVKTACQQACPAQAISFGNIADRGSTVAKQKASPRNYALLAELGTRPRTTYLARVAEDEKPDGE
jgi:Fe-S-cluster-containing dehydrogenase component